jgi:hypothetical protein
MLLPIPLPFLSHLFVAIIIIYHKMSKTRDKSGSSEVAIARLVAPVYVLNPSYESGLTIYIYRNIKIKCLSHMRTQVPICIWES